MTPERDTDRRLRDWLADGANRAPERFVWAAIDDIEHVSQRPAWRSAASGWARRFRPVAAGAGVAAALVVAVVVVLQFAPPSSGPGAPTRALTVDDLPAIVLWDDTKPAGWTLDNLVSNSTEVRRMPVRSLTGAELDALPDPAGLQGGRYTSFSGPDAVYISWGLVFERSSDAVAAMPFYLAEFEGATGWGLGAGTPTDLGDGGLVFSGQTTRLVGEAGDSVPARLVLWRHDNVLLALGGWFSFDAAELDRLAAGMQARAAERAAGRP
jgi:hypothetical protein